MRRHLRNNLVGYIALFFALGLGSAWAATELQKNEVKSKHIKNRGVKTKDLADGVVTSPKVANGSLLEEDFAAEFPQGPQGPEGEQGPQGSQGPQGERGPSDALYAFNAGGAAVNSATIAVTLNVPAGDYAVSAVARGENPASTTNPIRGSCTLSENPSDGLPNHGYTAVAYLPPTLVDPANPPGSAMLPATTVFHFDVPGTITYGCQASTVPGAGIDAAWRNLAITATRVDSLTG